MIKVGIIFKTARHYKVFDLGLFYVFVVVVSSPEPKAHSVSF